jgi:hypothetical protein
MSEWAGGQRITERTVERQLLRARAAVGRER